MNIFFIIKTKFLLLIISLFEIKKIVGVVELSQCRINLNMLGYIRLYSDFEYEVMYFAKSNLKANY